MADKELKKTEDEKPRLGMFKDISNDDYHHGKGISKSGLDLIARSPAHYITEKNNPRPTTRDLRIGHAFHCLTLEPDKFPDLYVKAEYEEFRTKESKLWRAEQEAKGKFVVRVNSNGFWNPSEWDMIHYMAEAVRKHPLCAAILANGVPEYTGYWIDDTGDEELGYDPTYRLCKFRMDWWDLNHEIIFDLKSSLHAGFSDFAKSCATYRYYVQSPWYRAGAFACDLKPKGFIFCAVEKEPPYAVGLYTLDNDYRINQFGRDVMRQDLLKYHDCLTKKEWPSYPDSIRNLELPGYVYFKKIS